MEEDQEDSKDEPSTETSSSLAAATTTDIRKQYEDYNANPYNECTIPLQQSSNNNRKSIFSKNAISARLTNSNGTSQPITRNENFTMVDLDNDGRDCYEDEDTDGLAVSTNQPRNKTSVRDDMIQSINSLRQNVNSHIIGGSKNVMGRVRKLSMSDLNRHTTSHRYKVAFYVALIALSFLFLYLIYQNLFNDK